ncbi:MAG: hypothetical protein EOM05_10760 [Clostridia bacterium]|nr:hypothetical protein [Clostridia bacterium]
MNRCTVFDKLEDEYGIKPENLTEREKAIIGLCTNDFLENEERALSLGAVVGRSEQLFCPDCKSANVVDSSNLTYYKCRSCKKEWAK